MSRLFLGIAFAYAAVAVVLEKVFNQKPKGEINENQ